MYYSPDEISTLKKAYINTLIITNKNATKSIKTLNRNYNVTKGKVFVFINDFKLKLTTKRVRRVANNELCGVLNPTWGRNYIVNLSFS